MWGVSVTLRNRRERTDSAGFVVHEEASARHASGVMGEGTEW